MPGCVLRVTGDNLQLEDLVAGSSLIPCNLFRKGEPKSKSRVWETSGITIVVSDAPGNDFDQQIEDAILFLERNREDVARLRKRSDLEDLRLDFGVDRKEGFLQCAFFPPRLVKVAGELGIGLELSIYG